MGRSREHQMRAPSKIKINVLRRRSHRSRSFARSLAWLLASLPACLPARGLPTPLVQLAVPARMLSEYSTVCRFPLYLSRVPHLRCSRNCTSAHRDAYTRAHKLVLPLFPSLPSYISNLALSLSLFSSFFRTPFLPSSGQFCFLPPPPSQFFLPRSHPLAKSVERNRAERERERERRKEAGVKLPPSSVKRSLYPPLSSPLPSQSVFTPIPRQHHRLARDLRVEHPSVFNAAPLTRALSFLPSSLSHSYPFPLSLSSPLLPHLAVQTDPSRSLSLDRIPCARLSISPPLSDSPLALSRAEHEFGRGYARVRVPPRACRRGRVKPCV